LRTGIFADLFDYDPPKWKRIKTAYAQSLVIKITFKRQKISGNLVILSCLPGSEDPYFDIPTFKAICHFRQLQPGLGDWSNGGATNDKKGSCCQRISSTPDI
jgi:hypothetical protein